MEASQHDANSASGRVSPIPLDTPTQALHRQLEEMVSKKGKSVSFY